MLDQDDGDAARARCARDQRPSCWSISFGFRPPTGSSISSSFGSVASAPASISSLRSSTGKLAGDAVCLAGQPDDVERLVDLLPRPSRPRRKPGMRRLSRPK